MPENRTASTGTAMSSWYVLYTKPRHEKKLAERLASEGWTVYCPLRKTTKQWSDRRKTVEEPLFSSFIFVYCTDKERERVFVHASAVRYLYWLRKPAIVRDEEVSELKKWLGEGQHGDVVVEDIPVGSRVRISGGPFMGKAGLVTDHRREQVTIILEQMGMQVRINAQQNPLVAI